MNSSRADSIVRTLSGRRGEPFRAGGERSTPSLYWWRSRPLAAALRSGWRRGLAV